MNNKFYPDTGNNTSITQPNKDFIHTIKASHFDVGDPRPKSAYNIKNHYMSERHFLPRPGGTTEDDGVLITIGFDGPREKSYLLFIDATTFTPINKV